MDGEILNLEQATEFLGVSERTMLRLLREERVPARKIGREWRFSRAALLEWLGRGDSFNYLNGAAEQYRVSEDKKAPTRELLMKINAEVGDLYRGNANIRRILPEMESDVLIPEESTLRVTYRRGREDEALSFELFWTAQEQVEE